MVAEKDKARRFVNDELGVLAWVSDSGLRRIDRDRANLEFGNFSYRV
jgi:hypothetical protein